MNISKSFTNLFFNFRNEKLHLQYVQQIDHASHDNYNPRNSLQKLVSLKSYNDEIAESTPIPMRMSSQGSLHAEPEMSIISIENIEKNR